MGMTMTLAKRTCAHLPGHILAIACESLTTRAGGGAAGAIKAYAGANGSGALLGSIDLAANSGAGYEVWTPRSLRFSGTALSFDLGASANGVALDNISSVPEASRLLMLLLGGAAVLRLGRRRA